MRTILKKIKKPLRFVLALVPIAIAAGYFMGVYSWVELTDDVKNQILSTCPLSLLALKNKLYC